jgi:hypothetical protein
MRFINVTGYNPKAWRQQAHLKTIELFASEAAGNEKAFLDVRVNKIWTLLIKPFEKLSHNKCWFSEAYASVSDFQVEHFRPKKSVNLIRNKDPYPEKRTVACDKGYWWLSYEFENLRLAGGKPNQKKGTYFPLHSTSIIAKAKNNSWRKELPMLLDPCVKRDTELIAYEGTEPVPDNPNPTSIDHIRARISIEIYGLRIDKLKKARSRVFEEAKNYHDFAASNWAAMNVNGGMNEVAFNLAKENFHKSCVNLVMMLRPDREFTKMVYSYLKGLNQSWIDDFIISPAKSSRYL